MPYPEAQQGKAEQHEDVLTLPEAAAYLRVTEDALLHLIQDHDIPAQKIGGEWRFLKRALTDWLRYGHHFYREFRRFPSPWFFDLPPIEDLVILLEKRLLDRLAERQAPNPGSKEAVQKHFGGWRNDPTAEAMLAEIYKQRRGDPEGD
jgi:excisionase family DNA binding protein